MAGVTAAGYKRGVHKHLRRLDRVWLDPPIYFLTTCTHLRVPILTAKPVAQILLKEWQNARPRHGWVIGRYVIMESAFYRPPTNFAGLIWMGR